MKRARGVLKGSGCRQRMGARDGPVKASRGSWVGMFIVLTDKPKSSDGMVVFGLDLKGRLKCVGWVRCEILFSLVV